MPAKSSSRLNPAVKQSISELNQPGEPGLYQMLVEIFLRDSNVFLEQISAAVQSSDSQTVHCLAHTWKSNALGIGADELGRLCVELEQTSDLAEMQRILQAITTEYKFVYSELSTSP